ncbi:ribonuclease R [Pendulispora brunnea]|uniref:Ribonuclease R n=1 Tax=Pendulispora brunnea TaxID=2905690 RepID=A0ABZ2K9W9_9BACT
MLRNLPSRNQVLDTLSQEARPVHAREIATRLGVDDVSYPGFLRLLDDLVYQGILTARDGHKFKLSNASQSVRGEEREGFITIAPRGFGFVSSAGALNDDVFIPHPSLGGAMHGDKVKIAIVGRSAKGAEGSVLEVLERHIKRVAGTLRRRGKSAWLEPDDTRIRGPIVLPRNIDQVAGEGNSGKDGDAAVVTIARYPEMPDENPEGRLEAVLGKPGEISVEVAKVLVREQVEEVHSPEAFAEAEAYGIEVPAEMLEGREDLTHIPLPTIDPEDARDHDDAVWVERLERGDGYRAWIAIADVSSYVRPGTKVDAEALGRGCSIYLPDRAIPMLPRPLSSNLCSLLPDVIRLCLCAEIELDGAGRVKKSRLIRGFMRSAAKLTYGGVARALGLTDNPPRDPKAEEMVDGLRVAYELSRKLRTQRLKRGAVDFDLPEAKIVLGDEGEPLDVMRRAEDAGVKRAYQLIEELMLLANETVARWFVQQELPTVFRVHAAPDPEKLDRFARLCEQLGIEFDLEIAEDPKQLSTLVKSFSELDEARVLNMLLLRSMKQATYDIVNVGHFGLASKAYLHFTSPIRRYPDLIVHRAVHAVLLGKGRSLGEKELAEAAIRSSTAERRAMDIEREVADLYRAVFMRDRVGQHFEGNVTAIVGSGVFVNLDEPFVDVLVRFEDLGGGTYELDDDGLRAISESGDAVQLGDRMGVEVIDVSLVRRAVYGRRLFRESDLVETRKARRRTEKGAKSTKSANGKGGKRAERRQEKPEKRTLRKGKPAKSKKAAPPTKRAKVKTKKIVKKKGKKARR